MRVFLTRAEIEALRQACGEVTAGEMETWEEPAARALDRAWSKLTAAHTWAPAPEEQ